MFIYSLDINYTWKPSVKSAPQENEFSIYAARGTSYNLHDNLIYIHIPSHLSYCPKYMSWAAAAERDTRNSYMRSSRALNHKSTRALACDDDSRLTRRGHWRCSYTWHVCVWCAHTRCTRDLYIIWSRKTISSDVCVFVWWLADGSLLRAASVRVEKPVCVCVCMVVIVHNSFGLSESSAHTHRSWHASNCIRTPARLHKPHALGISRRVYSYVA